MDSPPSAGQRGTSSCGGSGDNHPHRTLHFHQRRDVEDDAVEHTAIEQPARLHELIELAALATQHPVVILRARDALGDGPAQDANDVPHPGEHLRFGQAAARHFVRHGQLPQRRVTARVAAKHFRARAERHLDAPARQHGQHRRQPFDSTDVESLAQSGDGLLGDEIGRLHLHHDFVECAVHQLARQSPDPQRGSAMRAGRPAHHRTDHVVEYAWAHGVCFVTVASGPRQTPWPPRSVNPLQSTFASRLVLAHLDATM